LRNGVVRPSPRILDFRGPVVVENVAQLNRLENSVLRGAERTSDGRRRDTRAAASAARINRNAAQRRLGRENIPRSARRGEPSPERFKSFWQD
jgi:hypothetical protein